MNFFDNDDEVHHLGLDRGNLTAQSIRVIAVLSVLIASACVLATEKGYLMSGFALSSTSFPNYHDDGITKTETCGVIKTFNVK